MGQWRKLLNIIALLCPVHAEEGIQENLTTQRVESNSSLAQDGCAGTEYPLSIFRFGKWNCPRVLSTTSPEEMENENPNRNV
jgi:hypothetical protein